MNSLNLLIIEALICLIMLIIMYKKYKTEGMYIYTIVSLILSFIMSLKIVSVYDYDVNLEFRNYLEGKRTLKDYINKLQQQEVIYPENYVKLRFLENHDQPRAKKIIPNLDKLKLWTEFMYFQKGTSLIYNGQEALEENTPSLFEIDKINFNNIAVVKMNKEENK